MSSAQQLSDLVFPLEVIPSGFTLEEIDREVDRRTAESLRAELVRLECDCELYGRGDISRHDAMCKARQTVAEVKGQS